MDVYKHININIRLELFRNELLTLKKKLLIFFTVYNAALRGLDGRDHF